MLLNLQSITIMFNNQATALMKKLLSIAALLISLTVNAQTYNCSQIAFTATDGGVEFDFDSMQVSKTQVTFKIQEETNSGVWNTIIDLGNMIRHINGTITIPGSINCLPTLISVPSYTLTIGKRYRVVCQIPTNFHFKYLCHNNFGCLWVRLLGLDNTNRICFRETVANIPCNQTMCSTYWLSYGTGAYQEFEEVFTIYGNEWPQGSTQFEKSAVCVSFSSAY
jgi:hypothetical protein